MTVSKTLRPQDEGVFPSFDHGNFDHCKRSNYKRHNVFFIVLIIIIQDAFEQIHLDKGVGYSLCVGTESYYRADPDDCHNFFGCVYDEHLDTFHVYKFRCQDGLAYEPESHSCQDEKGVDRCWFTCPKNWHLFQDSCYFFTRSRKDTFQDAKQFCQDKGAYLVEIESKDEDDFIIEVATSMATGDGDKLDYWIGAEDLDRDGIWHWTTSGNPLVYTNWWTDMGNLNSTCTQLLKNGRTSPGRLDSFYWAHAAAGYKCNGKDGDNGAICEKNPDVTLPE